MITAAQLRAARALLGIDQRQLAELSGLSVPTIQRMEASEGTIRGNVDSLVKLIDALGAAGVEVINEGAVSSGGGRGVRLKTGSSSPKVQM
ncbi:helix-turn-helix transcriptional regulator [Bradyrhizobium sp. ISRA443]|uniref:helix-turn-helix domain-containing protein n=1 Tax=unclassified Bradyrhizobium TaxID=2631580 RepID=UPI002478A0E6|nr:MULTISPECIES: helix-turn-helix transcriptional regulator [unclassified Bradyrhizobium]WGR91067.1 helix-turn-helix transcriptional regulator [Bradyrhizobium sp. ISRA435]WGS01236.1 helix-turn-helix transcriptional regulator [Bradyrhizobium sp. ISRA436]WGS08123.1 helix-turn-helix transcriptional regulator [Bradyrhizobium sp. ISRA437]WGS15011.1 helix-turn-helix transcriptional regulator [Bradyrhizobium sp. ISRA443]